MSRWADYNDSSGVSHGYIRSQKGVITVVDYPGASTAARALPCGGIAGGTVLSGISDRQDTAGHYWDSSNNEHAFSRTPGGIYQRVDYPGAFRNRRRSHQYAWNRSRPYLDKTCTPSGYIAYRAARTLNPGRVWCLAARQDLHFLFPNLKIEVHVVTDPLQR